MPWDSTKSVNPGESDGELTSTEWNNHVDDQQRGKVANRVDVTSQSYTASAQDSAWVDTNAAGGPVTITLPADADVADGQRVEVGIEDASNDTDVAANTGQSVLGTNPTLTQVGDTATYEFKSDTSTWMVR